MLCGKDLILTRLKVGGDPQRDGDSGPLQTCPLVAMLRTNVDNSSMRMLCGKGLLLHRLKVCGDIQKEGDSTNVIQVLLLCA